MRRYGRFVDGIWIQQRMRLKDARVQQAAARAAARREAALVAEIARLSPAGTDPAIILAVAQAALQKAGAQ